MYVYLLHFDRPISSRHTTQHYIGFAECLATRIQRHESGNGARLVQVAKECWKSDDKPVCIREEYQHRIVELQARYRLVPSIGPVFYACEGNRANGVVVTFFETEPPTLIAECGDSTSLMTIQRSASGTRYEGRNESFWEHQGEARIQWGYDAPEMTCEKVD